MGDDSNIPAAAPGRRRFIASPWHTLSILLIFGYFAFRDAQQAQHEVSGQQIAAHGAILRGYLLSIAYEWGMAFWAWGGVRFNGGTVRDLTGGRWPNWKSVALDVGIAIPFWGVWELTAWLMHLAVDRVATPTTPYHPPSGFAEAFLWFVLSVSAGICEEMVFRGYLQKQFQVGTRSIVAGVILQGTVFGLVHAYQCWKQAMVIAPLGILYGALVAWRGNLRASVIAHAWSDIFEGWLRFL
jgi:membrane protease YdiL (CAAX protease family)